MVLAIKVWIEFFVYCSFDAAFIDLKIQLIIINIKHSVHLFLSDLNCEGKILLFLTIIFDPFKDNAMGEIFRC
jgi:hypothetical protein